MWHAVRNAVALVALGLAACSSAPSRVEKENDRLREQVLDQETELKRLQAREAELEAQLKAASATAGGPREDVRANTPAVVGIDIDSLSHTEDRDGDGRPDELVVYVSPRDGLGRFVPMVGDLTLHAAALPAGSDAVTLGRLTLGPAALRDAYRSSLMGTHYTIEVPLKLPDPAPARAQVQAEFVDGVTGGKFTAERGIDVR